MKKKTPNAERPTPNLERDFPEREIDEIKGQLPLNDQLGLEWRGDNGERYRTQYKGSINPKTRIVDAKITTWVGSMAIGAMHWYAHIEPDAPDVVDLHDNLQFQRPRFNASTLLTL